jgi:flagellar hook-associated protein 2
MARAHLDLEHDHRCRAGLTLKLTGTNAGSPTTIGYSDPASAVQTAMNDLVEALNQIVTQLNSDTDATTGSLTNNAARARCARCSARCRAGWSCPMPPGQPSTLGDLGLKINRNGTFASTARS